MHGGGAGISERQGGRDAVTQVQHYQPEQEKRCWNTRADALRRYQDKKESKADERNDRKKDRHCEAAAARTGWAMMSDTDDLLVAED
jgi:hypothetical protein